MKYIPPESDVYLSLPDVLDPSAFAARVHGDSMAPKYRQDDIVIFSPRAAVQNGDDAFIRFVDGEATFKRVYFEGGTVRLQPLNPKYAPRIVPRDDITMIARAVFRYSKV